jgi:hypothetical protein
LAASEIRIWGKRSSIDNGLFCSMYTL